MQNITMLARDAISAREAECFVTIEGRRYNFMNIIDLEVSIEKHKTVVNRLGAMMDGNKSYGMAGTFSGTKHYNSSIMRELLERYKDTGFDFYFEIQITNNDPDSAAGRQTVVLYDCNTDGGTLSVFDAAGETLEEPIEGTFEDFKIPESFKPLMGM